jgi:hypothetical protein
MWMKTINGFDELLSTVESLPDAGWLYVDTDFDLESKSDILLKKYYLAENETEEMDFEENFGTFVEAPIFRGIVENKLEQHPGAGKAEFLEAVVYYLEHDDFVD